MKRNGIPLLLVLTCFVWYGCGTKSHPNRINSITLSPTAATIAVGQTQQFSGSGTTNSGQTVTGTGANWVSSNTSVATVDQNGLATAVGVGTTSITATVQTGGGPVTGSATLTVTAAVLQSITLNPASPFVTAGTTQQFTATGVYSDSTQQTLTSATWTSSNTSVASINSSGLASASSVGSTTITASVSGINGSTGMTVTAASTNSYVGTQSPGDLWLLSIDDSAKTFSATNQSASLTYSGTFTALPNGFYKTSITTSNDPNLPAGTNGYALEVPGVALVISLGGSTDKPIAAIVPGPCPTISSTGLNADLINLGHSTYDSTTSESYAAVSAMQSGSNYNFTVDSYLLDGTLRTASSGPLPNSGTCTNGVITVPSVPDASGGTSNVTAVAAPNGLYVLDLGRNSVTNNGKGGAVGTTTNIDPTQLSTAMTANYLGFLFKRNSTPITTLVGFGPGSGTSITGGTYVNQDSDPFDAHGTTITINLPSVNGEGFLQGTVTDSNGAHRPFVAMITNSGGQYFLFGITTDTSSTTPYAIVLAQQ